MTTLAELATALGDAQRLGFLGGRPIEEVIAHSRGFVRALSDVPAGSTVIDLGAGGGVPGLVVAFDRPDLGLVLLDRRTKRTDFLDRVVRRLGWTDRVSVVADDATNFAATHPASVAGVVARGFGPPEFTVELAGRLVQPHGRIVISDPPHGDRWDDALVTRLGLRRIDTADSVAIFTPI